MSYIKPELRDKFEKLSIEQKNRILENNVQIYTEQDLMNALKQFG